MKKKVLVISYDLIKKVNIRVYEELSKYNNLNFFCLRPKNHNGKKIFSDHKKKNKFLNIIETNVFFNHKRLMFFEGTSQHIKNVRPSHIILHSDPVSLQTLWIIILSFFFKFKICCYSNENKVLGNLDFRNFFRTIILIILNFFIKFRIDNILCISKQIKKNYNFLGYKRKTILIPLGFDEKIFYLRKKKKNKSFNISYFGRICYQKGLHTLISAITKLDFDFKLNIDIDQIDDIDYFKDLINQCKQNLIFKKIKFIKCDHFTISKHMSVSDLIVVPSIYQEQYGRVIQEGVACGSLVIGSNAGAIPEIICDKDLIFEKENYKALATLITKLNNKLFYKNKFKRLYNLIMKKRSLSNQVNILIKSEIFK
tara:strand:- start:716 stop:1822 length:1107 start_codon:yes stop_codon:yes gene_type:complete